MAADQLLSFLGVKCNGCCGSQGIAKGGDGKEHLFTEEAAPPPGGDVGAPAAIAAQPLKAFSGKEEEPVSPGGGGAGSPQGSPRPPAEDLLMKHVSVLEKDPQAAKKMVQRFVSEMVKGAEVGVISNKGQSRKVTLVLSRKLDGLTLKLGGQSRKISLREVVTVTHTSPYPDTPPEVPCATMQLTNGEAVCFEFQDAKKREEFAVCLLIFTDAQKGKRVAMSSKSGGGK